MKKTLNIILLVALPFLFGGGLFALLVEAGKAGIFNCLLSHDVLESHLLSGFFPLFTVISFFLGVIPASILTMRLLLPVKITAEAQQEEEAQETPVIYIGQIFTAPDSNCKLRVKALKTAIFSDADFSSVEYALNFSF